MTDAEFKKELSRGLSGGYLFFGEEDYLKHHYLEQSRKSLLPDEAFAAFNHIKISGEKYSGTAVCDAIGEALSIPPMMCDKKLIELSELDLSSMKEAGLTALLDTLSMLGDHPESVLILNTDAGSFDPGDLPRRPSAQYKRLCERLTPVSFEKSTQRALSLWVQRHFAKEGVTALDALCSILVDNCGRNMYLLHGEISKLTAYIKAQGRTELERADIDAVACSDIETDVFALANSVLAGDTGKAFASLLDMNRRKIAPDLALASIARVYSDLLLVKVMMSEGIAGGGIAAKLRMHEYKVRLYTSAAAGMPLARIERALKLCSAADLAIKSSTSGYTALERLVCDAARK